MPELLIAPSDDDPRVAESIAKREYREAALRLRQLVGTHLQEDAVLNVREARAKLEAARTRREEAEAATPDAPLPALQVVNAEKCLTFLSRYAPREVSDPMTRELQQAFDQYAADEINDSALDLLEHDILVRHAQQYYNARRLVPDGCDIGGAS